MSWYNPLSWFGSGAFQETLAPGPDRANVMALITGDSRLYITRRTRQALNQKAEWLWNNFGIVKEGVATIGRHTVGKGMSLQIDSEDTEWNELAEQDFENYALTPERCDLAGRRTFYEAQTTAIEQRVIRGEFFAALAENPEWDNEPCFQIYDSEEIGQPLGRDSTMPTVVDGVELNKDSRAVAYWLKDWNTKQFSHRIERARMLHWYKPHATNQTRGITDFAQAVNPLVDIHELKRLATRSGKAQQIFAVMMKGMKKRPKRGALGAIENAGRKDDGTPDPDSSQLEEIVGAAGGGIFYADDENADIKLVTSDSPSPLVEAFITDLLMRDALAAAGLPSEFIWNPSKLGSANQRFILARADLFFQIMGDRLIDRFNRPIAFRYLSHRVEAKKLRECKDKNWWMRMSWQAPERITIDNGRDGKMLIELLANGMITLREYCNKRGLNYRNEMRQWIREPIEFIKMAAKEGAPPEMLEAWKRNPPIWRAGKPGAVQADGADPANNSSNVVDDNDEQKAAA